MASSDYLNPIAADEVEPVLEEADVYKATTNSDYVVIRRVRLYRTKFITYHNIHENEEDNKQWILTTQCELEPRTAAEIKESCSKYVRPRGQWAITTLVKSKSMGTKGQEVRLFMFTLGWPTRWAAKGYTSFTFGFPTVDAARLWHTRISECLESTRLEKASASFPNIYTTQSSRISNGNGGLAPAAVGLTGASSSAAVSYVRPGGTATAGALSKAYSASLAVKGHPGEGPRSALEPLSQSAATSSVEKLRRVSQPNAAKRSLVYDNSAAAAALPLDGVSNTGSSFASATTAAAVAAGFSSPSALGHQAGQPPRARTAELPPPPPPLSRMRGRPLGDPAFSPSSSDSEAPEDDEDEAGGPMAGTRGSVSVHAGGIAPCRMPRAACRGTARGDVRHTTQRWVPYKQVNGVAIYHRPQTAGDLEAGVGGEFMVSTVVRGSPRRCLAALTCNLGNTSILGPATVLEVLQRRLAVDGNEIQRIVVQAPGLTGVICAPRELVVETVIKTDETGPTLELMFKSCEPPARFVERRAGDGHQQYNDEVETVEAASESSQRSWWGQPVSARVRGGYAMAPLEEYSLDNSPEALVTCIMKVDLGGVCGERSWLRLAADLVGWTDAFLDRMLMGVTLLRDEVEQGRFVVQPLSVMASSSKTKERERERERERDGPSLVDLVLHRNGGEVGSGAGAGPAAAGSLGRRSLHLPSSGRGVSRQSTSHALPAGGGRSRRREVERPSLVDGPDDAAAAAAGDVAAAAAAAAAGTAHAGGGDVGAAGEAAYYDTTASEDEGAEAGAESEVCAAGGALLDESPLPSPSAQAYETLEDVLRRMRNMSFLDPEVWDHLHQPGKDAPFKIRGPTYLKDRKKIPAGHTRFILGSMDVIELPPGPVTEHVARFIPAIRQSGAPFSVIIHLVIPGTPLLGIVATFVSDRHPSALGAPPVHPMEDEHDWEPFDFVLRKYMNGSTHTRNHMLKLIPHIADGSWMIKQSVGTTPVILGKQLRTIYYETPQYIEIDIDISANNVASYVTGLVRGATRSLVIDMGFVLEGTTPWELPEALLGTLRLYNLDIRVAKAIDVNNEIPLRPTTLPPASPCYKAATPTTTSSAGTGARADAGAGAGPGAVNGGAAAPITGSRLQGGSAAGVGSAAPLQRRGSGLAAAADGGSPTGAPGPNPAGAARPPTAPAAAPLSSTALIAATAAGASPSSPAPSSIGRLPSMTVTAAAAAPSATPAAAATTGAGSTGTAAIGRTHSMPRGGVGRISDSSNGAR